MRALRDEDVAGLHGAHVAFDACTLLSIVAAAELANRESITMLRFADS